MSTDVDVCVLPGHKIAFRPVMYFMLNKFVFIVWPCQVYYSTLETTGIGVHSTRCFIQDDRIFGWK